MKKMAFFLMLLFMISSIYATHSVLVEVQKEDGNHPGTENDDLNYKVWLRDENSAEDVLTSGCYFIVSGDGVLLIEVENIGSWSHGDLLHIWAQDGEGGPEGIFSVVLNYENSQVFDFSGSNEGLTLCSVIDTKSASTTGETYSFPISTRGNQIVCTAVVTSPNTGGDISVGLLASVPVSIPVSGETVDFGFMFDDKDYTGGGTGFTISITWNTSGAANTYVYLESTTSPSLFLTFDGVNWVNSNYASTRTKIGMTSIEWTSVDNADNNDNVQFTINQLPKKIVFGDGVGTYTETTPNVTGGQTFASIDESEVILQWTRSEVPSASYTVEYSDSPYGSWSTASGTEGSLNNNITFEISGTPGDHKFYRVKAVNSSSGESSYCAVFGYKKHSLSTGWNLVSHSLGKATTSLNDLSSKYGSKIPQAPGTIVFKTWNDANQQWVDCEKSSSQSINHGNCYQVYINSGFVWYNTGATPSTGMVFTLDYSTGVSGYNYVILPWDESATAVSDLYTTLFGTSSGSGIRTISWYDNSIGGIISYDYDKINSSDTINPGDALIIHVNTTDNITWPTSREELK